MPRAMSPPDMASVGGGRDRGGHRGASPASAAAPPRPLRLQGAFNFAQGAGRSAVGALRLRCRVLYRFADGAAASPTVLRVRPRVLDGVQIVTYWTLRPVASRKRVKSTLEIT